MISVCIPVFNRDMTGLVEKLRPGLQTATLPVELIVADDGSSDAGVVAKNEAMVHSLGGKFIRYPENQGRSLIRKELARKASFPFLLFIDADCVPASEDFISMYVKSLPADVVCGGLLYCKMPEEPALRLHWKYGIQREIPAAKHALLTSNFCVRKELMIQVPDLQLPKGYGHEDSWMEAWFRSQGTTFYFIDNPVYHLGLKEAGIFLHHQEEALENLLYLSGQKKEAAAFLFENSSLLKMLKMLKRLGLTSALAFLYSKSGKALREKLTKGNLSLYWLDVYKLGYAAWLLKQSRR